MNQKLYNILSEQFGVSLESITLDTDIFRDLGADSLDIVETQISIEKEYDIEINQIDYENRTTVRDLLEMINGKLGTQPN